MQQEAPETSTSPIQVDVSTLVDGAPLVSAQTFVLGSGGLSPEMRQALDAYLASSQQLPPLSTNLGIFPMRGDIRRVSETEKP